jgi:hypothetical protein
MAFLIAIIVVCHQKLLGGLMALPLLPSYSRSSEMDEKLGQKTLCPGHVGMVPAPGGCQSIARSPAIAMTEAG